MITKIAMLEISLNRQEPSSVRLTFTILSMSGTPSDGRSGLSFVLVTWTASVQFSKFAAGPRQHSISSYL
jgi:hypothetical protein